MSKYPYSQSFVFLDKATVLVTNCRTRQQYHLIAISSSISSSFLYSKSGLIGFVM